MKLLTVLCMIGVYGAAMGQEAPAMRSAPPRVTVDGKIVHFPDMQPIFVDNHVMVPIRGVFEYLHSHVMWDNGARQVTCVGDKKTIDLNVGDNEADVNGAKVHFDAPVRFSHNRTLVPLRFLSEALDMQVDWDDATQTVKITSAKYRFRKQ
jgi:spore coat protein H